MRLAAGSVAQTAQSFAADVQIKVDDSVQLARRQIEVAKIVAGQRGQVLSTADLVDEELGEARA